MLDGFFRMVPFLKVAIKHYTYYFTIHKTALLANCNWTGSNIMVFYSTSSFIQELLFYAFSKKCIGEQFGASSLSKDTL